MIKQNSIGLKYNGRESSINLVRSSSVGTNENTSMIMKKICSVWSYFRNTYPFIIVLKNSLFIYFFYNYYFVVYLILLSVYPWLSTLFKIRPQYFSQRSMSCIMKADGTFYPFHAFLLQNFLIQLTICFFSVIFWHLKLFKVKYDF